MSEIYLGPRSLSDFERAIGMEWIVTNGLGGYASSTTLNINTRKYHGLLVASLNPPVERHVFLAKIDVEAFVDGSSITFYSNEFINSVYPEGYMRLRGFSLNPFPTHYYACSGLFLKSSVFMPYMKNAVVLSYEVLNTLERPASIDLHPLVNSRHFYEVTDRTVQDIDFIQKPNCNRVIIQARPNEKYLAISSTDGHYSPSQGVWIDKMRFRVDELRGESFLDDNYIPGYFRVKIPPKGWKRFYLISVGGENEEDVMSFPPVSSNEFMREVYLEEAKRRQRLIHEFYRRNLGVKEEDWLNWLISFSDSYLVFRRSTDKRSIIAGYHWFEDWGRDSLISLPGLTLVTGRFREAEEVLFTFKKYVKWGLIPNRFPDREGDKPVYDSVDTTLWFFNAVLQYLEYTGNLDFVRRELWETLKSIIEKYIHGTMFNIQMDSDYLLKHGPRLTWMDAIVNGVPYTPREGKAVEVQALWYNALRIMEMLAKEFSEIKEAQRYGFIAEKAMINFNENFWSGEYNYLFDVVDGDKRDLSIRPNQIIPVFLDFSILKPSRSCRVVEVVWRELWGNYGLRSLSKNDPRYVGRYIGGFSDRNRAYHNGTVWIWLLGPFVSSFLKVKNHGGYWRDFAFKNFMKPVFIEETYNACLGTLSEICDGDTPNYPRGCISQAWSVAEALRALVEDIYLKRPPYEKYFLNTTP